MQNSKCKVSVLMLTYNQEHYVDEAIQSVMHQITHFNYQLVIGDDCSTDSTLVHCEVWQNKYPDNIIILKNGHNTGLLHNFMRTYNACTGEYIAICEGDDYWIDKRKLQRQADFLDTHSDYSTCVHRVVNYYQDDRSMSFSNGGQKAVNDIIDLATSNFISNVSAVFRRGLFGELPAWILDVATYDYAIHLLNAQYGKIYYMNRCMAVYRKHNSALWSQSGSEKQYLMAMKVRSELMTYFMGKRDDVYAILLNAYGNNAIALMRYYKQTGQDDKIADVKTELLKQDTSKTSTEIETRINAPTPRPTLGSRVLKILKHLRATSSRLLLVPHPC